MGHYENGGSNAIGVATTSSFAAVWTVDTPYIEIIKRGFFDKHEKEIREANARGESYTDDAGQSGVVDGINTGSGLTDEGWPRFYDTPAEYVAAELKRWEREFGATTEEAIDKGYAH